MVLPQSAKRRLSGLRARVSELYRLLAASMNRAEVEECSLNSSDGTKAKSLQLRPEAFVFAREIFWRRVLVEMPPNGPTMVQTGARKTELSALHHCGGSRDSRDCRVVRRGLGTQRAQPTGGKPCARNHELRPTTIQAHPNVRGGRHGGVTQSTRTVAIQPDFCRDDG